MMAPESERAMECGSQIFYDTDDGVRSSTCHKAEYHPELHKYEPDPNPNEPTLTCSEVVERLAAWFDNLEAGARSTFKATDDEYSEGRADAYKNAAHHLRTQAPAILHSWRERRVQEPEEALRLATEGTK